MKFNNEEKDSSFINNEGNVILNGKLTFNGFQQPGEIVFMCGSKKVLVLDPNGDIYVKGKLVENDKKVVECMRDFLKFHNKLD